MEKRKIPLFFRDLRILEPVDKRESFPRLSTGRIFFNKNKQKIRIEVLKTLFPAAYLRELILDVMSRTIWENSGSEEIFFSIF